MMHTKHNIVCVGDLMLECLLPVHSLPHRDETVVIDAVPREVGGPAFNFCWYFAQCGFTPLLVTTFGNADTTVVAKAFERARLDTGGLIPVEGCSDYLVAFLSGANHRSVYVRSGIPRGTMNSIERLCRGASRLVMAGSRHPAIRRAFRAIIDGFQGEVFAFNPSYAITEYEKGELAHAFSKAHITMLNEHEAKHSCEILGVKSTRSLAELTAGTLLVSRGAKGVDVFDQGSRIIFPSVARSAAANIGAGDALFAGVLMELFRGKHLSDAVQRGSELASRVIRSSEVRAVIPRWASQKDKL